MTETRRPRSTPLRLGVIFSLIGSTRDSEPIVYHGVQMRSQLEANFARHLDGMSVAWEYEPAPFFKDGRGYLPDFRIELGPRPCYVEVKPTIAQGHAAKRRMAIIWDTQPDAFLVIACGEASTFFGANLGGPWTSWTERWKH